jgi:hypothetical protein
MQAVAGYDAECGMSRILKVGIFGGDDDVTEQRIRVNSVASAIAVLL